MLLHHDEGGGGGGAVGGWRPGAAFQARIVVCLKRGGEASAAKLFQGARRR